MSLLDRRAWRAHERHALNMATAGLGFAACLAAIFKPATAVIIAGLAVAFHAARPEPDAAEADLRREVDARLGDD